MQIEKYELTKKNKYNVFLSNGEVLTLDERVITENELLLKKTLDQELYDKVTRESKIYELVDISIKYISIRLRSIQEIKNYLQNKTEDKEIIDIVTSKLLNLGYLDDDKFTKAFIKDKLNFTSMGEYKIKMHLQRLGISYDIIEENISMIDENVLEEKMKKQIEKYLKSNRKYTGTNLKNKIYNHLVSEGFTKERVIRILNNYNF